ncbi:MAG: hypothetical protein ACLP05_06295 [Candidatus Kryptoniota bacterium]
MLKSKIKLVLSAVLCTYALTGCTNRINETGSWLVGTDSTLVPRYIDSVVDSFKVNSSQVNTDITTGSSAELSLGSVPWTEADLLLEFYQIDSVYSARTITSAQLILTRAPNLLQPAGYDVKNLQFAGYVMDSTWDASKYTWDSVEAAPRGRENIVLGPPVINDSTITINIDTGLVRQWSLATIYPDSNFERYGFLLKPENESGILSAYSSSSSYPPTLIVSYIDTNGVADVVTSAVSYSASVAHTTITNVAPHGPYRILQSGTGLREKILFNLPTTPIPNLSIVNYAQLTLFSDTLEDALYSGNSEDSLEAFCISDPSTNLTSTYALSTQVGNKYTFDVTDAVQQMLNTGNYGFLITRFDESTNVDTRFIYDESAPDSLKPRLTMTYSPVVKKK